MLTRCPNCNAEISAIAMRNVRRGICRRCYRDEETRDRFEVKETKRPPPRTATDAEPGSPEKVAILAARWASGEQLHHPDDAMTLVAKLALARTRERAGFTAEDFD